MKYSGEITLVVVSVLIGLALIGGLATNIRTGTSANNQVDTFTGVVNGSNLQLTRARPLTLNNLTNTTDLLADDADYDDTNFSSGFIRILSDHNISLGSVEVNYENEDGVVTGSSGVLLALVTLLVIAGLIVWLYRTTQRKR